MILDAAACLHLDLRQSWLIGDTPSDIEAGMRAELAGVSLVATGNGAARRAEAERLWREYGSPCEFFPCASLPEAMQHILTALRRETPCQA